jgi:predicted acyl esterase
VVEALGDTATVLAGYTIDPVARISIAEDLRYAWFDYVFRGGPKPALLADRINYEVTGANVWRHAPSIAAMANGRLRFYLGAGQSGDGYRMTTAPSPVDTFVTLRVNLADRADVDRNAPGGGVLDTVVDTWNGLKFVSEPLSEPTELSGLFSGNLDFITNKRDFDFNITLYEWTAKGEYMLLTSYWARASHVGDLTNRRLLAPGERQRLSFTSVRLMSRLCQPGSRLVVVLSIIKNPGQQINYGTGRVVSDETIADAGEPLTIRWLGSSFLDLPRRR